MLGFISKKKKEEKLVLAAMDIAQGIVNLVTEVTCTQGRDVSQWSAKSFLYFSDRLIKISEGGVVDDSNSN